MSKIIITKKQAEFIEGFKELACGNEKVEISKKLPTWASYALHNLMQFGFGSGLNDVHGKKLSDDFYDKEGDFQHDQVPLLIEAVMHGYEVEKDVILYIEFGEKGMLERRKLYYGTGIHVTNKSSASPFNLNVKSEKERVVELKEQGWKVEEVE